MASPCPAIAFRQLALLDAVALAIGLTLPMHRRTDVDVDTLQDLLDLENCGLPVVWPTGWDSIRARISLDGCK